MDQGVKFHFNWVLAGVCLMSFLVLSACATTSNRASENQSVVPTAEDTEVNDDRSGAAADSDVATIEDSKMEEEPTVDASTRVDPAMDIDTSLQAMDDLLEELSGDDFSADEISDEGLGL